MGGFVPEPQFRADGWSWIIIYAGILGFSAIAMFAYLEGAPHWRTEVILAALFLALIGVAQVWRYLTCEDIVAYRLVEAGIEVRTRFRGADTDRVVPWTGVRPPARNSRSNYRPRGVCIELPPRPGARQVGRALNRPSGAPALSRIRLSDEELMTIARRVKGLTAFTD